MLGSLRIQSSSSSPSTLIRPRSVLEQKDQLDQDSSTFKHMPATACSSSLDNGDPPAKKRRLNEDDLIAREELDLDEDWEVNDRFDIIGALGVGTYGIVYKAIDRHRDNEIVAVKKITFQLDSQDRIPSNVTREITNLRYLRRNSCNPPIIRLLDAVPTDGRHAHEMVIHMVFEYMEHDLDSYIRNLQPTGMQNETIKDFFNQILVGVEWMHLNNIVHRDLKPQNILVTNKTIKIADFGLSRVMDDNVVLSTQVVTQWYRSPEVLLHSSYSKPVDIWSLGCIFAEMFSGRPLFASKRKGGEKAQLEEIFRIIGTPHTKHWPSETQVVPEQFIVYTKQPWSHIVPQMGSSAQILLSKLLLFQANERASAYEALQDDYFLPDDASDTCPSPSTLSNSPSPTPSPPPLPSIPNTLSHDECQTLSQDTPEGSLDSGIHDM